MPDWQPCQPGAGLCKLNNYGSIKNWLASAHESRGGNAAPPDEGRRLVLDDRMAPAARFILPRRWFVLNPVCGGAAKG
jgi:hypothetical protein